MKDKDKNKIKDLLDKGVEEVITKNTWRKN